MLKVKFYNTHKHPHKAHYQRKRYIQKIKVLPEEVFLNPINRNVVKLIANKIKVFQNL